MSYCFMILIYQKLITVHFLTIGLKTRNETKIIVKGKANLPWKVLTKIIILIYLSKTLNHINLFYLQIE